MGEQAPQPAQADAHTSREARRKARNGRRAGEWRAANEGHIDLAQAQAAEELVRRAEQGLPPLDKDDLDGWRATFAEESQGVSVEEFLNEHFPGAEPDTPLQQVREAERDLLAEVLPLTDEEYAERFESNTAGPSEEEPVAEESNPDHFSDHDKVRYKGEEWVVTGRSGSSSGGAKYVIANPRDTGVHITVDPSELKAWQDNETGEGGATAGDREGLNPETQASLPSKEELHLLTPEGIEQFRHYERERYLEAVIDRPPAAEQAARARVFRENLGVVIEAYLLDKGVADPALRQEFIEYLSRFSTTAISDRDWYSGHTESGPDGKPVLSLAGIDIAAGAYQAFLNERGLEEPNGASAEQAAPSGGVVRASAAPTPAQRPSPAPRPAPGPESGEQPAHEQLSREELEQAYAPVRDQKLEAFVARQNAPLFGKGRKKEEYRRAEGDYYDAFEKRLKEEIERQQLSGVPESEVRDWLIRTINEQITADSQAQRELLLDRGGRWAELMRKYEGLTTGKKVAYGLGITAVTGVAGAALGFAGATAGVVTAATMVGRFGRGYALGTSKKYSLKPADRQFSLTSNGHRKDLRNADINTILSAALDELYFDSRDKLNATDKVKENALKVALGTTILGGTLGLLAGEAIDRYGSKIEGPGAKPDTGTGVPDGEVPRQPAEPDTRHFSEEARTIERGEGWRRTMREIGIPRDQWDTVLDQAGPELVDQGIAYFDADAGEYRLNLTQDGKMPQEALNTLYDTWQGEGTSGGAIDGGGGGPVEFTSPSGAINYDNGVIEINRTMDELTFAKELGLSSNEAMQVLDALNKLPATGSYVRHTLSGFDIKPMNIRDKNIIDTILRYKGSAG